MGCGSSKETGADNQPDQLQRPPAASQVPLQQQQYHQYQQQQQQQPQQQYRNQQQRLQPQQQRQFQEQRQPQQGLQQLQSQNIPSPPSQSSPSSTVRVQSAPGAWPKVIKLGTAPFTIFVYAHKLTSPPKQMPCWTYISRGLSEVSQSEVVFTVLRRPNENVEAFPESPLEWIKTVYGLANSNLHLETGQMVDLVFDRGTAFLKINQAMIVQDPKKWESMKRFGAFVHGIPLCNSIFQFPHGTLPPSAHHVIALTHEETAVAKQFGVTRVMGHLGLSVSWFPYPPWIDRDRGDSINMADQAESIRIGIPIERLYGLNAMLVEDDIVFTIPVREERRKAFKDYVLRAPLSAAVGFDSFMVGEAKSGLTWKKGQTDPMGYASNCNGSMKRLNLAFIMFAPQQDKDYSIMCEDGYGILIRDSTWKSIRDAVQNTQDITVPLEDDKRFILRWKRSVYHNPIDGGEYTASWCRYDSSGPPKPRSNSHVQLSQVVFLVEPPVGAANTEEFAEYINQIIGIIEQQTPANPLPAPADSTHPGRQAVVEIELPKCEGWLKMTAYPSMDGLDIQEILARVAALREPEARAIAKFQLFVDLWGYQGPAARFS